ncbi:hypothetical protein HKX48_000101 [Thoreauomyces humboldtii]|nr:hypothetical protein HKX48_000101 [Thoreauomyces humboldtii]
MTDQEAPEQKPDAVQHINLKVVGGDGSEIAFKIKRTTPLQRLMDAYVNKTGQDKGAVRFIIDGNRINGHETPDELEMEDGDMIQVSVQQAGDNNISYAFNDGAFIQCLADLAPRQSFAPTKPTPSSKNAVAFESRKAFPVRND